MFQEFTVVYWDQVNQVYQEIGSFTVNVNAVLFLCPLLTGYSRLILGAGLDYPVGQNLIVKGSYEDLKKLFPIPSRIAAFPGQLRSR